ncbi:MAG: hypothetical protein QM802_07020 [Agriterribacter sp.]
MQKLSRRHFLYSTLLPLLCGTGLRNPEKVSKQFFFTSQGKTAVINIDGSGLRFLDFNQPGQVTWQPAGFFPGGQKILLLSMEERRDGPGKPFSEYYTQTPTHIWSYDMTDGKLTELATRNRMAVFYTPALLLANDRMLVQVSKNKTTQIFNMRLDGSDAIAFTQPEDGVPYGLSMRPDGKKVAFHIAGPAGYEIFVSDTDGRNRLKIMGKPDHLYFGTSWSPDGKWILYVDCHQTVDPGHDWADVCISSADGKEHRILTKDQAMWFASSYGNDTQHGNGSNVPAWTTDGKVIFPCRLPGSKVPWEYNAGKTDTDHFNRTYKPALAKGSVSICSIDIDTLAIKSLTNPGDGYWDFRASQSPDGKHIVFCRVKTGAMPSIWLMHSDGSEAKKITDGYNGLGADHPRWMPLQNS